MLPYGCRDCGEDFMELDYNSYTENLDGERGVARFYIPVCPYCGSERLKMRDMIWVDSEDEDEDEEDL